MTRDICKIMHRIVREPITWFLSFKVSIRLSFQRFNMKAFSLNAMNDDVIIFQ